MKYTAEYIASSIRDRTFGTYEGELFIKRYAQQVANQALKDASDNALVNESYLGNQGDDVSSRSITVINRLSMVYKVDKKSILETQIITP